MSAVVRSGLEEQTFIEEERLLVKRESVSSREIYWDVRFGKRIGGNRGRGAF